MPATFRGAWKAVLVHPRELLIRRWNWKSALLSSLGQGTTFLAVNLSAGLAAARGAMLAEFVFRACKAGFSGALTQAFRRARPRWAAADTIPLSTHALEFAIHRLRGTPDLRLSIAASLLFTALSTLFNLHAMGRGVLVVGRGSKSLIAELRALPAVLLTYMRSGLGQFANPSLERME